MSDVDPPMDECNEDDEVRSRLNDYLSLLQLKQIEQAYIKHGRKWVVASVLTWEKDYTAWSDELQKAIQICQREAKCTKLFHNIGSFDIQTIHEAATKLHAIHSPIYIIKDNDYTHAQHLLIFMTVVRNIYLHFNNMLTEDEKKCFSDLHTSTTKNICRKIAFITHASREIAFDKLAGTFYVDRYYE